MTRNPARTDSPRDGDEQAHDSGKGTTNSDPTHGRTRQQRRQHRRQ
ncbi:MAG: hypothetical protein J07HX64_02142 [halophilic archaeon J07HX64]|nr:MAG: hypothetical protein J07HX64_02142 [halophilic archaeon J07HX64]